MKLVTWSLATFHATAFVLAIVLFAYSRDALGAGLSGLNSLVGLGLFVALWGTTYVTTSRALKGLDPLTSARDRGGYPRRGLRWGAVNGIALLGILRFVALLSAVLDTPADPSGARILFP